MLQVRRILQLLSDGHCKREGVSEDTSPVIFDFFCLLQEKNKLVGDLHIPENIYPGKSNLLIKSNLESSSTYTE
jgi:hypothetical protein